jgi:hypothetical protein
MTTTTSDALGQVVSSKTFTETGLLANTVRTVRLHERGLSIEKGKQTTVVPFDDLVGLAFGTVATAFNGVPNGLIYDFVFSVRDRKPIRFKVVLEPLSTKVLGFFEVKAANRESDEFLDEIESIVTNLLAQKMLALVENGERVSWAAKDVFITRDGLELERRRGTSRCGFHEFLDTKFHDGEFHLTTSNSDIRKLILFTGEVNFWPGLAVVQALCSADSTGYEYFAKAGN